MIVKPTIFQRPSHLNSFFLSAILIYRPQSLFQKLTNRRVTATAKIFSCPAFPLFHKQLSFCQNREKRSILRTVCHLDVVMGTSRKSNASEVVFHLNFVLPDRTKHCHSLKFQNVFVSNYKM